MTINDFIDEYDNLTQSRKADFFHNLISSLVFKEGEEKEEGYSIARNILVDLLEACVMEEEEDYFGTEGFDG